MVQIEGQNCDAFEAILVKPGVTEIEAAYDLTSDLLDMFWEVKREILEKLEGNQKSIIDSELSRAESGLLMAQKSLNDMVTADAKITK